MATSPETVASHALATRESFANHLSSVKATTRRQMNQLALIVVPLGVVALAVVSWAERNLAGSPRTILAVAVFLVYLALIGILVLRVKRMESAARVCCPHCSAPLYGVTARVALAIGRCEACTGELFATPHENGVRL